MKKAKYLQSSRVYAAVATTVLSAFCITSGVYAQGDGPRAFFPAPDESNLISVYGLSVSGNQSLDPGIVFSEGNVDLDVGVLQYTRSFAFGGQAAGVFAVLPYGEVSGSLSGGPVPVEETSSGFGDAIFGAAFTLYGMPAMGREEYVTYDPEFALGLLTKVIAPTGEYDSDKSINLGANRWAFQLGLPTFFFIGDSLVADDLTTIDITPSVLFFTDNDSPSGGDDLEQDPIFQVEGHITRNLNRALWVSLDSLYVYGGETTLDGVAADNDQRSLSLGVSLGMNFSPTLSAKFSYGEVVERNDDGPDGEMFRLIGAWLF